eukprot:Colp12_sorted_trinity150504_noHs@19090
MHYDVWGSAVQVANLMESSGAPSKLHISEDTYAHVVAGAYTAASVSFMLDQPVTCEDGRVLQTFFVSARDGGVSAEVARAEELVQQNLRGGASHATLMSRMNLSEGDAKPTHPPSYPLVLRFRKPETEKEYQEFLVTYNKLYS